MDCNEINQHILGFISGTLPEKELREFNEHLASCDKCDNKVIAERELDKLIKDKMINAIPVAPDLKDKIIKKIEETPILKISHFDGLEESMALKENLITVGRAPTNTIALTSDVKLSRKHCQIEYKDDKYEIADLDSGNGVYVNEQKVTKHCLNSGDKIRIGQTEMIFGLPVVKEAPATEAPQSITAKKHIPHIRHIGSRPSAVPYVAAAAVVFALIGFLILRSGDNNNTRKVRIDVPDQFNLPSSLIQQSADLQPQIDKLNAAVNSLSSQFRFDEALKKCKEFVNNYEDVLDKNQKSYLEVKIYSLEQSGIKEKDTKEALVQLEKEIENVTDVKFIKFKYDNFYATSANTSLGPKIKAKIDLLDELEKTSPLTANDLTAGNYVRAIDRYLLIRGRSNDLIILALVAREIDAINNKAKSDYDSIIRQGQELIAKNDYEKAKSLYYTNMPRFRGTSYFLQINAAITSVNEFIRQGYDNKTVAQKTAVKIIQEVDDLLKAYNYSEAVQKSNVALKTMGGYYPEVTDKLTRRLPDIEKQSALFDNCVKRINGKEVSLPRLNLKGLVSNPSNGGFNVSGKPVKWASLNPDEVYGLYKINGLILSEPEGMAIFCLEHKLMDGAFEALNALLQKSPKSKPELDALLARYTGKKVPPDGFVIYKNKWISPDEKATVINMENAVNLAAKVKTVNKSSELEKICQEFDQLIQSNQSQASEFKEIIIKALQQKTEDLKAVIQKKLANANMGQLSQLRKELNQKRKEALKELREGKPTPPPDHPGLSKEMDEKIRAVKELWDKPAEKALQIDKSLSGTAEMLKAAAGDLKKYTVKPKDKSKEGEENSGTTESEEEPDIVAVLVGNATIDIRTFPLNTAELRQMEYNQKAMKANEENKVADNTEKEMVRVINEYRIMMGLQAFKIDDRLSRASRKHSDFMRGAGKLAHEGIGDGTPSSRCATEGYTGPSGENCAAGQGGPVGYFTAWYWSHGHHLNMIGNWFIIGGGISGDYATTNFGQ